MSTSRGSDRTSLWDTSGSKGPRPTAPTYSDGLQQQQQHRPPPHLPPIPTASDLSVRLPTSDARGSTSVSQHDSAAHHRQRGESSPVISRQREGSQWREADAPPPMMRRQSSGASSAKRLVDGREETRDERRARKEWERQQAESMGHADPSRRRSRSSRSSGARAPPALADDISQLSLGSPPTVSAARPTASSSAPASSKSVLTIALQRAQSAVLLDSANNVPAAIAAYSQSVRLLKEVMARVDESARREREKEAARGYYRSVPRAGETFEDFERRVARTERKERAKQDEARRLKVIHDTYEDRIRMLQAVQSPSIGTEDGSAPSTPSTVHAEVSQSIVEPSPGSAALSRREGRSIQSLSTVSTPPATFAPATALPALDVEQVPPTKDLNASSLPSPAIEGIGSAMLVSSPPTSPTGSILPSFVTNAAPTVVTNGHDLEPPQQAAPTQRETLEACADVQQRVTYGASNVPTSPRAAPQSPVSPKSPGQSKLDTSKRISRLPRSTSLDTFPINVSLDRPLNSEVADDVVASLGDDEFHAGAVMQRTGSAPSATAYAMGRTASGSSMQRTASGESAASSRGTSLFGPGGFRQLAGQDVPSSGAEHNSISARYSAPAFGLGPPPSLSPTVASRPRPARSASSASTPVAAFADETESHHFVSASAAHGTNGQRRKLAPAQDSTVLEVDEESNDGGEGVEYVLPLRQGHQRGPSAEPTIPNEFGLAPQSSSGSYASASLPTRLRTFSQPAGKRPGLPSYHSEQPNLPPLHINTARSIAGSDSTPSFSRKTSLPIGISQHPPLKRSNSAASQQSLGDRDRESRIYSPTSTGADTPTFPSFPRGTAAPPLNLMSSPPLDGSFLADTSALSSVRRPFHLMRLILDTLEGEGAHLTPRLYVPHQVWSQSGVKLVAVETKVRMLDLLRGGLEVVTRSGEAWSAGRATAGSFARELDSLEGLMDGIQSTLSKKLGYGPSGKKAVASSFSAWSSKLSRSLDRVTNGRSLDHPATYIDALTRVLQQASAIDTHLALLADGEGPYATVSSADLGKIEQRLRRFSDFFAQVVCRFVMRDVGMLVDKYVKRAGTWFGEA